MDEDARGQLHEQLELVPEAQIAPDAFQRDLDVAIGQDELGSGFFRQLDALEHLGARLDAQLLAQTPIEAGHDQLRQQEGGLLLPDDLEDVHLRPVVRLGHRLVASLAQLNADGVGFDRFDRRADVLDALLGQVRGANEVYISVTDPHVRNTLGQGDLISGFHWLP